MNTLKRTHWLGIAAVAAIAVFAVLNSQMGASANLLEARSGSNFDAGFCGDIISGSTVAEASTEVATSNKGWKWGGWNKHRKDSCTDSTDFVVVTSDEELASYMEDYGVNADGKKRNLQVAYNIVSEGALDIHTPCEITFADNVEVLADGAMCLNGAKGVTTSAGGEFYLKTEFLEGRIDQATYDAAVLKLEERLEELRVMAGKKDVKEVLNEMITMQGEYKPGHTYLSSILLGNGGNCQAREKMMATFVQEIYPDMEIQYQFVKSDGVPHTRVLVEIDGVWHSMEKPGTQALKKSDFKATVTSKQSDYVKSYVGKKPEVKYEALYDNEELIERRTKKTTTDDYLRLKKPVSSDKIRDIAVPLEQQVLRDGIPLTEEVANSKDSIQFEVVSAEEFIRRDQELAKFYPQIERELHGIRLLELHTYPVQRILCKPYFSNLFNSSLNSSTSLKLLYTLAKRM